MEEQIQRQGCLNTPTIWTTDCTIDEEPENQELCAITPRKMSVNSNPGNPDSRLFKKKSLDTFEPIQPCHNNMGIYFNSFKKGIETTPNRRRFSENLGSKLRRPFSGQRRFSLNTVSKLGASEYGRMALRGTNSGSNLQQVENKVRNLIRVKNMFIKNRDEESSLLDYEKNGGPKTTRFTSLLSPEAQLALMKGYEDKTYEEISNRYPASKLYLNRPKSPEIERVEYESTTYGTWGAVRNVRTTVDVIRAFSLDTLNEGDNKFSSRRRLKPIAYVPSFPDLCRHAMIKPEARRRLNFPSDKKAMMSFRLENAMDIIDSVNGSQGFQTVSKRWKSLSKPIRPVNAYNKWTKLWKEDFQNNFS